MAKIVNAEELMEEVVREALKENSGKLLEEPLTISVYSVQKIITRLANSEVDRSEELVGELEWMRWEMNQAFKRALRKGDFEAACSTGGWRGPIDKAISIIRTVSQTQPEKKDAEEGRPR